MTLREALVRMNLRINHPDVLADMKIANYDDFCSLAIERYFKSSQFFEDMEVAVLDVQEGYDHGFDSFVLYFVRESENLKLKVDLLDYYIDTIDTYQ